MNAHDHTPDNADNERGAVVIPLPRKAPDEDLNSLGLDSMMAIEMKHRMEAVLQIEGSVLDLLQGATITGLSEGLVARLELGAADRGPDSAPTEHPETVDQLDELELLLAQAGPDELEVLLRELEGGDLAGA